MSKKKNPPANAKDTIRDLAAKGVAVRTIAKQLGTSLDTLNRWRNENPELEEALQDGWKQEETSLVGALYSRAINGTGQPAVTAAIFLLKSRHGYRENEPLDQDRPQINIYNLPASTDHKTYEAHVLRKKVEQGRKERLEEGEGE